MPRIKASQQGLEPHYKVRVFFGEGVMHVASSSEPELAMASGRIADVQADWIEDPDYGDTIGFIDWASVTAVTWRYSA